MAVFNRIRKFIEERGISRYRFWQDTQLGRDTAYRLCNDPSYIPTGSVLDKICSTYKVQPGEFLGWHDDEQNEDLFAIPFSTGSKSKSQPSQNQEHDSENEDLKLVSLNTAYLDIKVS
jgi:DNA-binding Xre family transcriptional regulator